MNASTRKLLLCTALIGAAGMAQAQATGLTRAAIESAYAEFERIEIDFGPTQVKVEAIDAQTGQVVEAIYDRATGVILKQETASVAGTVMTGIEVKNRTDDFLRVRGSDDSDDGPDDDGIDDGTGANDDDDDSALLFLKASAGQGGNDDRGRGRSGSDDSDDDSSDRGGSNRGGSDDDGSDGDDD